MGAHRALEAALLTAPNDDRKTNAIRGKTRLAKGVLYWRLAGSFKAARLERAPHVEEPRPGAARSAEPLGAQCKARGSMPQQHRRVRGARVAALALRLEARGSASRASPRSRTPCSNAWRATELEQQKERIGTYQIRARFALASIYDRAALGGGRAHAERRRDRIAGRARGGAGRTRAAPGRAPPEGQTTAGPTVRTRPAPRAIPSAQSARARREDFAAPGGSPGKHPPRGHLRALRRRRAATPAAAPKKEENHRRVCERARLVTQPDQKVEASASRAMDNYRRFLELQKTDPQLRAEALRRLGDLNMEGGRGRTHGGRGAPSTHAGRRGHQALHRACSRATPTTRATTRCSTSSRALRDHGPAEKALNSLDEILRALSAYRRQLDEVQFRRGELLFSARGSPPRRRRLSTSSCSKGEQVAFLTQSLYKQGLVAVQARA